MYKRRRRNPYQRIQLAMKHSRPWAMKMPTLEMVHDCFQYWLETQKPLPTCLMVALLLEVELLHSGHEAQVLRKGHPQRNIPMIEDFMRTAVIYVKTCRKKPEYDSTPIKTVCGNYGITSNTYNNWQNKYKETINVAKIDECMLRFMLSFSGMRYKSMRMGRRKKKEGQ